MILISRERAYKVSAPTMCLYSSVSSLLRTTDQVKVFTLRRTLTFQIEVAKGNDSAEWKGMRKILFKKKMNEKSENRLRFTWILQPNLAILERREMQIFNRVIRFGHQIP